MSHPEVQMLLRNRTELFGEQTDLLHMLSFEHSFLRPGVYSLVSVGNLLGSRALYS